MHGGNSSKSNEDLLNLNAISLDLVDLKWLVKNSSIKEGYDILFH